MDKRQTDRSYITHLEFALPEGTTWLEAQALAAEVIECGRTKGLKLIDGNVSNARERDAVQTFSFGSDEAWQNTRARLEDQGTLSPYGGAETIASHLTDAVHAPEGVESGSR